MKILVIPDLHGKDVWKYADIDNYDKIIFIGDYFDSFEYSTEHEIENFIDIVNEAKNNKNIVLLLGNHDIHYFKYGSNLFEKIRGSGYNQKKLFPLLDIYKYNRHLFKAAYQYENYLFTHAGISNDFYNKCLHDSFISLVQNSYDLKNLADVLNYLYEHDFACLFNISYLRGGNDNYGGIFWADREETITNPLTGYHQIVGHSKVRKIQTNKVNDTTSITYIDCLDFTTKFYTLEV